MGMIAGQFAIQFGWQITGQDDCKFRGALKKYWRKLLLGFDGNNDASIDLEEFLEAYKRNLSSKENYEEFVKPFIDHIFSIMDTNKDNTLQPEEFAHFYLGFRNSAQEAIKVFAQLDINGDGVLSRAEIEQHFYDFHFSQDRQAAGNFFFGML